MPEQELQLTVDASEAALRLDLFLARRLAARASRAGLQRLVGEGRVEVGGRPARAGQRLRRGQRVRVQLPAPRPCALQPVAMGMAICFEDADMLALVKPAGLAVHPGAGAPRPTLVHGLLAHCRDLSGVGGVLRPGIVHRLDAGTSGLMVVAKSDRAHRALAAQFAAREVVKRYLAVVWGRPEPAAARLDTGFARHRRRRQCFTAHPPAMAGPASAVRRAVTDYRCLASRGGLSALVLTIHTGRTHQIRVHLAERGCPVVGDPLYGPGQRWPAVEPPAPGCLALHAACLGLRHPTRGDPMTFQAPPPPHLASLLAAIRGGAPA